MRPCFRISACEESGTRTGMNYHVLASVGGIVHLAARIVESTTVGPSNKPVRIDMNVTYGLPKVHAQTGKQDKDQNQDG